MSAPINANRKAIRRLSKLPKAINLKQLMQTYGSLRHDNRLLQTPLSSRSPSISPSKRFSIEHQISMTLNMPQLLKPPDSGIPNSARSNSGILTYASTTAAMSALITKMNTRTRFVTSPLERSPEYSDQNRAQSMETFSLQWPYKTSRLGSNDGAGSRMENMHVRSQSTTGSLREFRL